MKSHFQAADPRSSELEDEASLKDILIKDGFWARINRIESLITEARTLLVELRKVKQ